MQLSIPTIDPNFDDIKQLLPCEYSRKTYQIINYQGDYGLYYFKIFSKRGENFLKIFNSTRIKEFNNEVENYNLLSTKITNLPKRQYYEKNGGFNFIIYDYIEGDTLYDKNNRGDTYKGYYTEIIRNISELQSISKNRLRTFSTLSWFTREFISNIRAEGETKNLLMRSYRRIDPYIQSIVFEYPGVYFDRNPRNILITSTGQLFHIDYEVLFSCTPIFDFIKLSRNGTDYGTEPQEGFNHLHLFSKQEELDLFSYFMKIVFSHTNRTGIKTEKLAYIYELSSLFVHLLYVAYCSSQLSRQSNEVKSNRQRYHLLSAINSLENITKRESCKLKSDDFMQLMVVLKTINLEKNGILNRK